MFNIRCNRHCRYVYSDRIKKKKEDQKNQKTKNNLPDKKQKKNKKKQKNKKLNKVLKMHYLLHHDLNHYHHEKLQTRELVMRLPAKEGFIQINISFID